MSASVFHVAKDGTQLEGTRTAEEVAALVRETPGAAVMVWCEGMAGWTDARDVEAIAALLAAPQAEPAAPPASGGRLGFIGPLFDPSFTSLLTPRMIQAVYVAGMGLVALGLVALLVSGAGSVVAGIRLGRPGPVLSGLLWIGLSPVLALLQLAFLRMLLELVLVVFAIRDGLERLAARDR